jgi:palmitoyl-protein thioesterase
MFVRTSLSLHLHNHDYYVHHHHDDSDGNRGIRECNSDEERLAHPILCHKVHQLLRNPESIHAELAEWAHDHGLIVAPPRESQEMIGTAIQRRRRRRLRSTSTTNTTDNTVPSSSNPMIPVVMAHGMGDSCFNDGMQHVVQRISSLLGEGVYSTCIPTGNTVTEDTNNGYFLNMDASVDVFATKVRADPALSKGFHAMGFSQGNNVIRGYIARYNDPPVHTFISVNGVNAGVGAVPYCRPSSEASSFNAMVMSIIPQFNMCDLLMEQASRAAYTEYAQHHSFQANYWRDPRESEFPTYQQYSQLAAWNNEKGTDHVNQTLKDNWAKTSQFVWVLATQDTMVWPREGEQWAAPDPNDPFNSSTIVPREKTPWFQQDLFGLQTAENEGKNMYEQFDGDHLQFDWDDFDRWVTTYFA